MAMLSIFVILAFWAACTKKRLVKRRLFGWQCVLIFFIYMMNGITAGFKTDFKIFLFYLISYIVLAIMIHAYCRIYPKSNKFLLTNIWCMLSVSNIILLRISYTKAVRQFIMCVIAWLIALIIPWIMSKIHFMRKYYYSYAATGIILLALVLFMGDVTYGAKLSLDFGIISVQPSEFIKIIYPMFIAGLLHSNPGLKSIVITTVLAGAHILLLILSRDLGTALILGLTYLLMIYVATGKKYFLVGGLTIASAAACIAYRLFSHVQVRVAAWRNPWSIIDDRGYQMAQSIFAIGTGGLFGMGLYDGNPNFIPVAEQDFIFSAIAEELGGFFALAIILICLHTFLLITRISLKCNDGFYKMTCLGFSITYGVQVFLTIGGVTKLIPSTGVTLPLISYGGSSLMATIFMFSIIQGFNIYGSKENETKEYE